MNTEVLIREYLDQLTVAAARLDPDRRAELLNEVREHIAAALAAADGPGESTVRNVLERLGRPEDIVAAEGDQDSAAAPAVLPDAAGPVVARAPLGAIEIIALLLMTLGAIFLPILGPLLGLVFVWLSTHWTRREKAIASVIVVVLLVLPLLLLRTAAA